MCVCVCVCVCGWCLGSGFPDCSKRQYNGQQTVFLWTAGFIRRQSGQSDVVAWGFYTPDNTQIIHAQGHTDREEYAIVDMNYQHWFHNEPDNVGGSENCVATNPQGDYQWSDERCDRQYCFVCEDRNVIF